MLGKSTFYYNDTLVIRFLRENIHRVQTDLFPWRPWGPNRAWLSIGTLRRKVSVSTDETAAKMILFTINAKILFPDKGRAETHRCAHQTRGSGMSWGSWVTLSIQIYGVIHSRLHRNKHSFGHK